MPPLAFPVAGADEPPGGSMLRFPSTIALPETDGVACALGEDAPGAVRDGVACRAAGISATSKGEFGDGPALDVKLSPAALPSAADEFLSPLDDSFGISREASAPSFLVPEECAPGAGDKSAVDRVLSSFTAPRAAGELFGFGDDGSRTFLGDPMLRGEVLSLNFLVMGGRMILSFDPSPPSLAGSAEASCTLGGDNATADDARGARDSCPEATLTPSPSRLPRASDEDTFVDLTATADVLEPFASCDDLLNAADAATAVVSP